MGWSRLDSGEESCLDSYMNHFFLSIFPEYNSSLLIFFSSFFSNYNKKSKKAEVLSIFYGCMPTVGQSPVHG